MKIFLISFVLSLVSIYTGFASGVVECEHSLTPGSGDGLVAIGSSPLNVLELLKQAGVVVMGEDDNEKSLLEALSQDGIEGLVALINDENDGFDIETALVRAVQQNHRQAVEFLLQQGGEGDINLDQALQQAAYLGHGEIADILSRRRQPRCCWLSSCFSCN